MGSEFGGVRFVPLNCILIFSQARIEELEEELEAEKNARSKVCSVVY